MMMMMTRWLFFRASSCSQALENIDISDVAPTPPPLPSLPPPPPPLIIVDLLPSLHDDHQHQRRHREMVCSTVSGEPDYQQKFPLFGSFSRGELVLVS